MNDLIVAWIRTLVPGLVGLVLGTLAAIGLDIDSAALTTVVEGAAIGIWYLISRYLEKIAPAFPWNGVRAVPKY